MVRLFFVLLGSSHAIACAQPQSEICAQYIACQQEYDAAARTGPTDLAQYQPDGIAAVQEAAANANLDVPSCG